MTKEFKNKITKAISNVKLDLVDHNEIKSRRNFNQYKVEFPTSIGLGGKLRDHLLVETYLFFKPYPYETKQVSNYIFEYLYENGHQDVIDRFCLKPFRMKVQRIDRTFIDKVFAICDYYEKGEFNRDSRHLYDIHKIWSSGNLMDKEIMGWLLKEVAQERHKNKKNYSAAKGYEIKKTLTNIITSDLYKNDYENITNKLLYNSCSYDKVKNSLYEIINSKLLPEKTEHNDTIDNW